MSELGRFDTLFGPMFHRRDDEVIGQSLQRYGQWAIDEIGLIAHVIGQAGGGDFIDLGANVGTHTVAIATLFPGSEIYALEAHPRTFQLLCSNITANGLANARAFNYLVSDVSAMRKVVTNEADNPRNLGAIAFKVVPLQNQAGDLVLQVALDDVYPANRHAAFVKADLQGMELQAFRGLRGTLARCHPALYFENGKQEATGELFDELAVLGYETFWHINFPFHEDNFRGDPVNVFATSVEIGTLCVHAASPLVEEFRRSLTPTDQVMGDHAWSQSVELNARLGAEVRAKLAERGGVSGLRALLLERHARAKLGAEGTGSAVPEAPLPAFADIQRAMLLDLPHETLKELMTPLVAAVPLDEAAYLERHPDVAAAVAAKAFASARDHYLEAGYFEGRDVAA